MDGSFACPECGSTVAVEGLAPGRQVRCDFCHRLLEVPYFPRVPAAPARRRRFGRPKWVPWAWSALAAVLGVSLIAGSVRFWKHHHRSAQEGSIHKLIASSRVHEAAGRLNQALIDLDAALVLAQHAEATDRLLVDEQTQRRQDLARREVESVLAGLVREDPAEFRLGDWLNLVARCRRDPDLVPLQSRVQEQFRSAVLHRADADLAAARQFRQSGQVVAALRSCDRIAQLLPHLAPDRQATVRHDVQALVRQLVATQGIVVDAPQGPVVFGAHASYVSEMLPVLVQALEAKHYLPDRAASPWHELWKHAAYHLRLDVSEHQEGNYLASENRLTRINARLTLTCRGALVWETAPTARTLVPLPNLPAFQASRLAVNPKRSDELERLLYDNARGQILEKFRQALTNMPFCPKD